MQTHASNGFCRDAADVVFMSNDAVPDPRVLMTRMIAAGKRLVVCTRGAQGAIALDPRWCRIASRLRRAVHLLGSWTRFGRYDRSR